MKKENLPDIDALLQGVNTADVADLSAGKDLPEETVPPIIIGEPLLDGEPDPAPWERFMSNLEDGAERPGGKDERLIVKIDRDLADSLDDLDIKNKCRSELVNAIVRSFFDLYLDQLSEFRRQKRSLFTNKDKA